MRLPFCNKHKILLYHTFWKIKQKKNIFSVAYLINIYYTFVNLKIRENSVRTDAVIRVRKCLICLD